MRNRIHKILSIATSITLSLAAAGGIAGMAYADAAKYTPYFNNSVWMGDIHLNVLATDYTSKIEGVSQSRGLYCLASQEDTTYGTRSQRGKRCSAQVSQLSAIKSSFDYAYFETL